jgi:hypothetical protein
MKQKKAAIEILSPYNNSVRQAYNAIYKHAKQLLSTLENEELRYTLEREEQGQSIVGTIVHEFISPLLYLRLECHPTNSFAIHYGFEESKSFNQFAKITASFVRFIYKSTSKDSTEVNIEDSVRTDYCIYLCSELYEYIEEQNKHHQFKQLTYRPTAAKRKQMQAVA